jgi:hypothetical protein
MHATLDPTTLLCLPAGMKPALVGREVNKMFGDSEKDLCATLSEMHRRARDRCNYNQVEAEQKLAEWIQQDRRLDAYDAARLAQRVNTCLQSGAVLELDAPELLKGGQRRPLDRSNW